MKYILATICAFGLSVGLGLVSGAICDFILDRKRG
jgi:hypothetical protein